MEFKIDTKNTFTIIMPLKGPINAKMTGALHEKVEEMRQRGSKNFIIDLQLCNEMDKTSIDECIALHEESYSLDQSLVFTGISDRLMAAIKKEEADLLLNIAPRMDEAVDIISMEILERELLGEE
jgi:anti-anti-sigma regulatory factor